MISQYETKSKKSAKIPGLIHHMHQIYNQL